MKNYNNNVVTAVMEQDLKDLKIQAVSKLNKASVSFVKWADLVRDKDAPYRFNWSVDHLRGANVASNTYILEALSIAGVLDRVITKEQKKQGEIWIRSMEVKNNSFEDPELLSYKPPMWGKKEKWPPSSGNKSAMDQYALSCLKYYSDEEINTLQAPPPPDWPQIEQADNVLEWIRKVEPNWSWICRMIRKLMDWYIDGLISIDPLIECFKYTLSRQNPDTGFWEGGITTSFKVLIALLDPMNLPVPNADRMIDSVLEIMFHPKYDFKLFPCVEFDAFFNLGLALDHAKDYRKEEVLKWAAHRVGYILDSHIQKDGGISSYIEHCIPTWLNWDMAPSIPQGDAFGLDIYGAGFNICIDMLDIVDSTTWKGNWRYHQQYIDSKYKEIGEIVKEILL